METNPNIEDQINKALQSVKNTEPVELPFGFSERVMNKLHSEKGAIETQQNNVRSFFHTASPLLKLAAVFILIIVNIFTLRLILSPQPAQSTTQYATVKDFVDQFQINENDVSEDLLTTNTPTHEQR
jgi:hypothetical protein